MIPQILLMLAPVLVHQAEALFGSKSAEKHESGEMTVGEAKKKFVMAGLELAWETADATLIPPELHGSKAVYMKACDQLVEKMVKFLPKLPGEAAEEMQIAHAAIEASAT